MIFRPILIQRIIDGEKTVTRRPIDGRTPIGGSCRYNPGKTYSIQPGMAKPTVARIRVLDVRREKLGDITWQDAELEGFAANHRATGQTQREDFLDYWHGLYGGDLTEMLQTPVWRIAFELVEVVAAVCDSCNGRGVVEVGS